MSEYARAASSQRLPFNLPGNVEDVMRWALGLLGAYLAIRLVLGLMRGPGRR